MNAYGKTLIAGYSPELSVVILCYQSGGMAADFVQKTEESLKKNDIDDYELILVGNFHSGSNDETPEVVRKLSEEDKKIIAVAAPKPPGGMMGWDLRTGLAKAMGKYIVMIDGDGQMPVDDIVKVYEKIKNENLDLVKTYRIIRGDSLWRKFISRTYNLAFLVLFPGFKIKDVNSKPKIITREKLSLLNLQQNDWFIDAEIMIQARRNKFKTGEVPTLFLGLDSKRRSFVKLPAIWEFIKNLIVYRFREFKNK
jgi:glycosyltransferase involved in cell wall biosynthesis